ncbi:hydrogenase maturation protease [candidate division KSB1 bacterium]|nr:hydrogenase maturation protease [candidate division KSB1 bacterium]
MKTQLPLASRRGLIIGVGNAYRHDDAAGLCVARRLQQQAPPGFEFVEMSGEGAALLEAWSGFETVILIDAVASAAQPGTVYRFAAHERHLPAKFFHYSSHAFSVAEAIELARALAQLPRQLFVYGIEGKDFTHGLGLSAEVTPAIKKVCTAVLRDIAQLSLPSLQNETRNLAHARTRAHQRPAAQN